MNGELVSRVNFLTITPYTSGTVKSSASFPESPHTRVWPGARPSALSFFIRYANACPFPAPVGSTSRSSPPLYIILAFNCNFNTNQQTAETEHQTDIKKAKAHQSHLTLSKFLSQGFDDFLSLSLVHIKAHFMWPLLRFNLTTRNPHVNTIAITCLYISKAKSDHLSL
jgi:hypothetical protein